MSILRSFELSVSRRLAPSLAVGLLLGAVGHVSAATFALDQKLTSADFTTDVPANVPDLEFGQAVAIAGNWMAVGAPQDNDGFGAVYLYERVSGTWAFRTELAAPVPQGGSQFGAAVDIYEAGGLVTVIVGAPLYDAASINQGRAYVYSDTNAGAGFSFTNATLTATAETEAHFGASVALFADSAAVGAPNAGATEDGSVTIRGRNTGGTNAWGQVATLKTGPTGSGFGTSVDLHGEYLIVGAPLGLNPSNLPSGQAYVYRQDQGGANAWGIKHTLSPSVGQPNATFGQSVGVWDSNLGVADSASHSMVGAPLFDGSGNIDSGLVTFYSDATINAQFVGADPNEQLGYSVALEGTNGIAGRPTRTISGQPNAGSVNTFSFNGTLWATNTINLAQTGGAAHNFFGYAVDLSGLVAITSAPGSLRNALTAPPGAVRAGEVGTLEKPAATWAVDTDSTVIAMVDLPNTATSQNYANDVDMTSDWLVVGVRGDAQRGGNTGAVYVYRNVSGVWTPHSRLTGLYSAGGDNFGSSVAIYGTRLVVGAPLSDGFPVTTSNAGSFYVYLYNGTHWVQTAHIQSPNPAVNGFFGGDVDYQGDVLVVGAVGENGTRGRAYAYRDLSAFTSPIPLNIAAATVNSATGFSVSVFDPAPGTPNDEVIAVGAYNENGAQGAAYVLSGASFATTTPLVDPNPGSNRYFGYAVSIHSGRVAVGAPTATGAPSGRVIVFDGSSYGTANTLPAASGAAGQFGFTLHLEGTSLLVGSPATAARAGLTHVYGFSAGNWTEQGALQPGDLATFDEYGSAVTQSNGLYAVGATLHDANSISNSGAAYVYSAAPEVIVAPTSLSLSETGPTSGSVLVSLNQAPAANVTTQLTFDSSQVQVNTGSGFGASPQTVTLTPANATAGVTVQIRAVDDGVDEADPHAVTVTTGATASSSSRFNGLTVDDIAVSIADNDAAGVFLNQSGGATAVSEDGFTDTYTLVLGSQPTATVNVAISFPAGELSVNGDFDGVYNTSFTTGNWNVAQTLTVAAVNDRNFESLHAGVLEHQFTSADAVYQGIVAIVDGGAASNAINVPITDNETAQLRFVNATGSSNEGISYVQNVELRIVANPAGGTPVSEIPMSFESAPVYSGSAEAADVQVQFISQTINAGATNGQVFAVFHNLLVDALVEGPETFVLPISITSPIAGLTAGADHTATIIDANAATLTLSGGASVDEGSGTVPLLVTLNTTGGATLEQGVSVPVTLTDGTAVYAGGAGDYRFAGPAQTLVANFAAGSGNGATQAAPVEINNDALVEGSETFSAGLGAVTGAATVAGGSQSVTLTDNDSASLSFVAADSTVAESVTPHLVQATLTITANGTGTPQLQDAASVLTLDTPGSASTPADYTLTTASLAFPASSPSGTARSLSISIVDDPTTEGDETFALSFGTATGAVTASGSHTVTITDNDVPGITVVQSAGTTAVVEGAAGDSYTVVLDSQPTADVTVNLAFPAAQLVVNGDADGVTGLTFTSANWNVAQTVNVVAVDDTVVEADPHSALIAQTASSADAIYNTIDPADVTVSIGENDSQQITFTAASSSVAEPAGTHVVNVVLNLTSNGVSGGTISAPMTADVVLTLATAEAADAVLATTQVTFPAGTPHNSTLPVTLNLSNDRLLEGDETLSLGLQLVTALGSVSGTHTVTITDDESATLSFVTPANSHPESTGTVNTPVVLTITGTGAGALALADVASVVVNHTPGTAASPADYSVTSSLLTYAAGTPSGTVQAVTSALVDDQWVEGSEAYTLSLGAVTATGAVTASGTHTLTIADNDSARFDFDAGDDTVGEAVGSFSKAVTLTVTAIGTGPAGLQNGYSVPVIFVEGTATEPEDFSLSTSTLNFAAGAPHGSSLMISGSIVDDAVSETNETFQARLDGTGMSAPYSLGRASTQYTITDNDAPGISVVQSGGTTAVVEGGLVDSYTVVLDSQPTADVTVNLTFPAAQLVVNGDTDGATALSFTPANWNVVQTVNVVAVDDTVVETDPHSALITQTTSSADAIYNAINPADVTVSIGENDTARIGFVSASSSFDERDGNQVVTLRLDVTSNGAPGGTLGAAVSVQAAFDFISASAADVGFNFSQVSFPAGTADGTQMPVSLALVNDRLLEGTETLDLRLDLLNGLAEVAAPHPITILDDETATLAFAAPSSTVAEAFGTGTTPVVLTVTGTSGTAGAYSLAAPAAVVITHTPGTAVSPADYSVSTSALTFPAGSVSGASLDVASSLVNDLWVEGSESFTLSLGAVTATGAVTASGTHTLTLADDDSARFDFAAGDDTVGEAVGSFAKPVSLTIAGSGTGPAGLQEAYALPVLAVPSGATTPADFSLLTTSLGFAAGALDGASLPMSVSIVDDLISEGDESFQVRLLNDGAPAYISLGRATTTITIDDNDVPGVSYSESGGSTQVTEAGTTDSVGVVLDSQPTADVILSLSGTQVSAAPATLTFTPANWNQAQTVTVTATDDAVAEGPHSGSVTTTVSSSDSAYQGLGVSALAVSITDNDSAGVSVVESSGNTQATEGGATDSYTVVLTSEPIATVTLTLSGTQVSTAPATLNFTAANWNQAQTVTVTASDDAVAEGAHSGNVSTTVSSSDATYAAVSVPALTVSITDNDSAGVSLVESSGSTQVTEGGATDSYTVALTSEPTATVTLNLSGTQVSAAPATLIFTAANWNQAQTVTVTALNDTVVEGPHSGSVSTVVSSSDGLYNGVPVSVVMVSITDNDFAGLNIADASVLEGASGTTTLSFQVSLNVSVPAPFTVPWSTANDSAVAPGDYIIGSGVLSFAGSAGEVQTLTVTVNGDAIVEADENFLVNLGAPSSAQVNVNDGQASGTLQNDDSASLSAGPITLAEGDSGITSYSFVLTLSGQVQDGFSVQASTRDDTAQAGSDYNATDLAVSFDGSLNPSRTVVVGVNGDETPEALERYWLDLSSAQADLTISTPSVAGEIVNDDLDADLQVSNTLLPGPIVKGGTVAFEVVVENLSAVVDVPAAAFSASLSDSLQALDWTCVADVGASCPASGSGLPNHSIALAAGSSVTYRIRATVLSAGLPTDLIGSTATVSLSSPYSDPDLENNTAVAGSGSADALFEDGFEGP